VVPESQLWLLGGITREEFLTKAVYYKAGDQVHEHYTIRPGHEIYNIEVGHLRPCREWLVSLSPRQDGTAPA
jgi:hypothetical protein